MRHCSTPRRALATNSSRAFRRAHCGVPAGDVLALMDHDTAKVLARTRSKTLRLAEDTRGLAFDLDVPGTSVGNDVLALAERGDLGGMSFGFYVGKDGERGAGASDAHCHRSARN